MGKSTEFLLSDHERNLIARTWNFRARAERSATKRFQRLHDELLDTNAPPVVIEMARLAISDEKRHAILCDEVAADYGWDFSAHQHEEPEPKAFGPAGLTHEDRLIFEIMAFCCFTETINASMLVETLKITSIEAIKKVLREILKDEVNHARLGWAYLNHMKAQGRVSFLSQTLPFMFQTAQVEEIFSKDSLRDSELLAEYGELSFERRTEIFRAVIRDVFFPGLCSMEIRTHTGEQWLDERGISWKTVASPS